MQLENGYLLSLGRDEAKAFFGIRDDAARVEFLVQQLGSADGLQVDCQSNWSELHDVFQKLNAEDSALDQCILGGRPMHQGDFHLALVRPDVVRALARQLAAINEAEFRSFWPVDKHDAAWRLCENIKDLYAKAAELGDAVVFVASK